mmetsp:Transcript_46522/g.68772  ORF Transcript_46522/g.68772 Transcript_46522/m.68772 type:complete len:245 (+) Transcript_46522:317-1051(+)
MVILSSLGMLLFSFFFEDFFSPLASVAPAASANFFLSSSRATCSAFASAAFAAFASLLFFTSSSLAMSLLYSSVCPISCFLRYAAVAAAFCASSLSFLVIVEGSGVFKSFIFIILLGLTAFGFSVSIIPSNPLGLRSFFSHLSSSSFKLIPETLIPTSIASLSASASASLPEPSLSLPEPPSSAPASALRLARCASNSAKRWFRVSISSALCAAKRFIPPRPPPLFPLPLAMTTKIDQLLSSVP